jgi:hypothetical protein
MITAREGTRFYDALTYIIPAIGHCPYWVWESGIIPDGPGAYATSARAPSIEFVKFRPMFCAGLTNLMLRRVGKRVPTKGDPNYDGGIAAYWQGVYGPGYFTGYDEPFDLEKAKRWARDTRSGVLVGRGYSGPALAQQGHVAVLLPSGYVLQSNYGDGLNWSYTIEQSHAGYYYTRMAHPANWINYDGDEF